MTRRGFVIRDLCFGLACLAIAASLLLVASGGARQRARAAAGQNQLRWMAGATSNYAADSADQFWSFSWKAGEPYPYGGGSRIFSTDLQAAAHQAVDIMRRLSGREHLSQPTNWVPHVLFTHLPLADYVGRDLPNFNLIAPADKYRLAWARDPEGFDRGEFLPYQPDPAPLSYRWVYTSSYLAPAAWYDLDNVIYQSGDHRRYAIPSGVRFGGVLMTDVVFPSQKVMAHDQEQRERGAGPLYCVEESARAPVLMADGSAGAPATVDSNPGWNPGQKTSPDPSRFQYAPSPWEAPRSTGGFLIVTGHYRWTRGGVAGRDFGGPEVDTGQP